MNGTTDTTKTLRYNTQQREMWTYCMRTLLNCILYIFRNAGNQNAIEWSPIRIPAEVVHSFPVAPYEKVYSALLLLSSSSAQRFDHLKRSLFAR